MTDIVVTVPKAIWYDWIDEGDLPDEPYSGEEEYHFFGHGPLPNIASGERVYIVAHGRLRGYAPLVRIDTRDILRTDTSAAYWWWPSATYGLVRHGGAVAVTIPTPIRGFQGWRYRWWERSEEVPFPDWMDEGVKL
jgi:hypothetical protein